MSTVQGPSNSGYSFLGVQAGSVVGGTGPNAQGVVTNVSFTQEQLATLAVSVQRERELYNNWGFVAGQPVNGHTVTNPDPPALTQPVPNNSPFPFLGPYTGPGGLPQQSPNVLGPFGGPGGLPNGPHVLGPWDGPGGLPNGPHVLGPWNGPGGLPNGPHVLGPWNGPGGLPDGPFVLGPWGGPGGLPSGPFVLGPWDGPGGLPQGPNVLGPFGGPGGLPQGPNVLGPWGGPGGLPGGPFVLGPFGGQGGLPNQSPPLLGPVSFGAPDGTFPFQGQFPS